MLGVLWLGSAWVLAEKFHVVQPGESIFKISRLYGVSDKELMQVNHLSNPTKLKVGQRLIIPSASEPTKVATAPPPDEPAKPPEIYTVTKEDTLASISRRFQVAQEVIRDLNGLKDDAVRIGQKLRLLALEPRPQPPPVEEKKVTPRESESSEDTPRLSTRYFFINGIKNQLDRPTVQRGRWKYIVLHHSGTPSGNAKIFDYYHRSRGMENGLAYHFVIGNGVDSDDGEIEVGGRWLKQLQGGHVKGDALNEISLGICFVGNFNETRPSKRQLAAAIELILYLRQRCGRPYPVIEGHREINPHHTDCPGKLFPLDSLRKILGQE
jgi:LysM repeat protein